MTTGLDGGVIAIVLVAAVLHATWNAIAHGVDDRLGGFALIGIADVLICGPAALVVGFPARSAWPFLLASSAVHVVYQLLLWASYQLGEFSQVYPLARGTSPWVVALVSITVLHHALPAPELLGVLTISVGLISLVFLGGRPSRAQLPALGAALATGLCIAGYTVIDGTGVAHTSVSTYTAWLFLLQGPGLPLVALALRGRRLAGQLRPIAVVGLLGGAVSLAAYGLVLVAQTSGALAAVAALRETSIVIGAIVGALFFGERLGRGRALASAVVVLGIVLTSLG